jgi:DNA-binding transcriptional LysR family regulator
MSVNENKYNCFFQNVSSLSASSHFTEKVRYDTTIEFNGVETIKQCVMAGVGVTILPEITVAEDISQGRLAPLS